LPAHSVVLVVMTIPLVGLTQPVAAPARVSTAGVPSGPTAQALGRTQSAASKVRFNVDMASPFSFVVSGTAFSPLEPRRGPTFAGEDRVVGAL
jgi:hypothetical protein